MLVETGTGVRMSDKDRDIKGVEGGDPAEALRAVGEDPASIDFVVAHPPALRPCRRHGRADGRPAFPNARYVVQRDEAEAAHGDELRVQGIMEVEQLDAVRAAGQLAEVNGEVEVMPGVRVLRTGGHTRGSQAVLIGVDRPGGRAGDPTDRAVFWGDLIPTRWQVPVRWTSAYDDYPIDAIEVRNELVARAAAEGWWCYFTHDPGEMPVRHRGHRARVPSGRRADARRQTQPDRPSQGTRHNRRRIGLSFDGGAGRIPWSRHLRRPGCRITQRRKDALHE